MTPLTIRSLFWLPGPLIAVALVAFALIGRGGPGFLFLAIAGGVAFMFAMPVLQLVLLTTSKYRGRYRAACVTALFIVFAGLCIPIFGGVFNFW